MSEIILGLKMIDNWKFYKRVIEEIWDIVEEYREVEFLIFSFESILSINIVFFIKI